VHDAWVISGLNNEGVCQYPVTEPKSMRGNSSLVPDVWVFQMENLKPLLRQY